MSSRIEQLIEASSLGTMRPFLHGSRTFCPASPCGDHAVTGDNPLPQGRCLSCRRFVRRNEHGSWAVADA